MQNFDYQRRTFLMFGRGRENEVGSLVKFEGGRRVLLHYGPSAKIRPDLLDRIKRSLDRAGLEFFELPTVDTTPSREQIYRGIDCCRELQLDFILAIGRSAVIDAAKAISAGTFYSGDFWDFFSGRREPVHSLPLGAIVTTTDMGSESSSVCILTDQVNGVCRKFSKSSPTFLPRFAILNPELSLNSPLENTAAGTINILAHVLSCYFTNTPNVQLTDELCEGIMRTIVNILPRIIEDPNDYDARANLMLAGTLAQNGMCALGREVDHALNILEMEVSARYNTAPEAALSVLMPAWLSFCLQHNVMQMAKFAHSVFGVDFNFFHPEITAHTGIHKLRQFMEQCSLPQNFADMGLKEVDIHELVTNLMSHLPPQQTIGSYVKLDASACETIYTTAYTYRHPQRNYP